MKRNLLTLCVHSQHEYLLAIAYFKRIEKRRLRNKIAKKSK